MQNKDIINENVITNNNDIRHSERSEESQNRLQRSDQDDGTKSSYSPNTLLPYYPKKKSAFTLAEVLITLGVIGVVAAITIPTLITKYQKKQTAIQLRKAYSEICQAVDRSKAVNGDISSWDFNQTSTQFFDAYLSSYIKLGEQTVGDARKNGITYYGLSGNPETSFTSMYNNAKIVTLSSGVQLIISSVNVYAYNETMARKIITIDLNGFKKPNTFGKDLFSFVITKNKGVVPCYFNDQERNDIPMKSREQLQNGPSLYSIHCNKNTGRGLWCSALIMMDGWEINYDW